MAKTRKKAPAKKAKKSARKPRPIELYYWPTPNAKDQSSDYARKRYTDEVHRLLGVMNKRLATRKFLAGAYSIADMACWGWVIGASRMHDVGADFPHVKEWRDRIGKRPAVVKGFALGRALREQQSSDPKADEERRKILFGQRARA